MMQVLHTIAQARQYRSTIGPVAFVPTMGALHAGHLSLVEIAKKHCDRVAVSIFVNPTQFGPHEDFNKYPRPIERDLELCEKAGVDFVFNPSPAEMYRSDLPTISIDLPDLTGTLEGAHRPGHFQGVCQVVAKLFNIVQPQVACFGRKDFQQLRVLCAMVEAMDFPIRMIACPTLRDPDGLAMSSRNAYLSAEARKRALSISRGLFGAIEQFKQGQRDANVLVRSVIREIENQQLKIDYVAAVDSRTLKPVTRIDEATTIAVAGKVDTTRLIDNVELNPVPDLRSPVP